MAEKKTRNVPQLTKDVRRLSALKKKRAKIAELDAEIAALGEKIAGQLGLNQGQKSGDDPAYADAA